MKTHLMLSLCVLAASALSAREFTDQQGRKLDAEVVAVAGDQVSLKRAADGRAFTVPVATFSAADQGFIKEWGLANQKYSFDVTYEKKKVDSTKKKFGAELMTTETWSYKIALRNRLPVEIQNLRVDYWVFKKEDQGKGKGTARVAASGSNKVDSLKGSGTHSFDSLPVSLNKTQLEGNFIYIDGTRPRFADAMGGLVVRVFDPKNREVFSYASDNNLLPAAAGQTRGSASNAGN
ncbi:hypothetical protein [Prosthecobacter sp.]|uniref:hypothetical protein n=1 Tax=Prosthecobacter sp. TaxID=1965333 RepID=UPI001E0B122B|nr:hypothetical protein [Prosthecobacter sp.]MCB1275043.1 hypothetical protein [Prosthecobacter sp.]